MQSDIEVKRTIEVLIELNWIEFVGTEEEIARTFSIACSHLEAVTSALNENPALKRDVLFATKRKLAI